MLSLKQNSLSDIFNRFEAKLSRLSADFCYDKNNKNYGLRNRIKFNVKTRKMLSLSRILVNIRLIRSQRLFSSSKNEESSSDSNDFKV